MIDNVTIQIISINILNLFMIIMLNIFYFSKPRIKRIEHSIFARLIVFSLFGSIFGLSFGIVTTLSNSVNVFANLLEKTYTIIILDWLLLLSFYTYAISEKKENSVIKKTNNIDLLLYLSILLYFIPINLEVIDKKIMVDGPLIYLTYVVGAIFTIFNIVLVLKNYKNIKEKKYIPIYSTIILTTIFIFVQTINPDFNYLNSLLGMIIGYLMYFTIENPDMKMLEEVHRAKEISDNANEEKTLFLYNMTNDIRSIIKDIDDSADCILDEIDNKKVDKELIKETARDIKSSTAKFTTMTNEILDISSIDTSSIKVYNNKYNIKLLLKQLITSYKEKCKDKELTFRSNIDTTLPQYLYGDSVSLKKVIDILLENSYKYTEKGFIELSVNTIIKNDIARLIITVEDSGTGMKIEELNKAINTKKEEDSTNLNNSLYNAKKLITLMNGTIVPSSTYGSGTSIKIILDQKVYEEKSKTSKYNKELDKKRILLVDDNIASQKLFTKILSNTNIELDIVSLGKECLDKIRNKEKYDLILLDEEMKPLSGIEVITKLKNIKNFNTKVILLTKNNDYEYNEDYLKYGFIDYILKPLDKTKVLDKIGKYLK